LCFDHSLKLVAIAARPQTDTGQLRAQSAAGSAIQPWPPAS
jgi:hypothetical protein